MKITNFKIKNYRAISKELSIDLTRRIIPLVGINECGKTTILQSIFCFDFNNDNLYDGRHLKNIDNLYSTAKSEPCKITAEISCTKEEYTQALINAKHKLPTDTHILLQEYITQPQTTLQITRSIIGERKQYTSENFMRFNRFEEYNTVCQSFIEMLPCTLYNDDFTERPVNEIDLTQPNSDWYIIFNKVFQSANKDYNLAELAKLDDRLRDSIIDDVETHLGKNLTDAWSNFSPFSDPPAGRAGKIITKLKLIENRLLISIKEENKAAPANFFYVTDRSKGFIWYYNLIMKILFNPKPTAKQGETIFLLDEPGSYLHESAQTELCKKIQDISKTHGTVIFCTHSSKLLNPRYIPLNNVIIVEKQKIVNRITINITPLPARPAGGLIKNDTKSIKTTTLQPIYEALLLPEFQSSIATDKIIIVEGIYDMYSLHIFGGLSDDIKILPSTGASAIVSNISYFIAYQKQYVALWDNDKARISNKKKATQIFGIYESQNFITLPNLNNMPKVRMEEMIAEEDYDMIKTALSLPVGTAYEVMIASLFFAKETVKNAILSELSEKTVRNFFTLKSDIYAIFNRFDLQT
ncbi:MAG: ATP-binding protein [Defluviitaleaceae bacterium]|nr:ATP-binding protein [Defluviitaleaceae bacterium]